MPSPVTIKIVSGANTWYFPIDGEMRRKRIPWPRATPTSGKQDADTRLYSNALSISNIVNAFGPYKVDGADLIDAVSGINVGAELAKSQLRVLRDSEADTRFGERTLPRKENNPAINPGATGDPDVAGDGAGGVNLTTRAAAYYAGTTNTGVFTWYEDDQANVMSSIWWNGSAWGDAGDILTGSAASVLDVTTHKNRLYYLLSLASVNQIRLSLT